MAQEPSALCFPPETDNLFQAVFQHLFALAQSIGSRKVGIGTSSKAQDRLTVPGSVRIIGKAIQNRPIAVGLPIPAHLPKCQPHQRIAPKECLNAAEQRIGDKVPMPDMGQLMEENMVQRFRRKIICSLHRQHNKGPYPAEANRGGKKSGLPQLGIGFHTQPAAASFKPFPDDLGRFR